MVDKSEQTARVPATELIQRAHDQLRDLIGSGELAPGAPIIETEVAARLGVSRAHLRPALQRLEQTGFVETELIGTYSRSRVAPLTLEDASELFAVLGALEGLAARNAAELDAEDRSALLGELRALNESLLGAMKSDPPDYQAAFTSDLEFHRRYVECGGGRRVRSLHAMVKPQADRYERMYTHGLIDTTPQSVREHAQIIEAIESGDADAAQKAVEVNWRNAGKRFERVMRVAGERGTLAGASHRGRTR